jgi:hypothetical protein
MLIDPPIGELLEQVLINVEPETLGEIIVRVRDIYESRRLAAVDRL